MSLYTTPIPRKVLYEVNTCASSVYVDRKEWPFEIRVTAFPGDEGEQMYAIECYVLPITVTPTDRRQKPFVQCTVVTFYFDDVGDSSEQAVVYDKHRYGG